MTATGVSQASEISEFVRSVRAELVDLPALTVDDLVDGLRADLGALVDDAGLPLRRVVSAPASYAAELRAGADLPPRSGSGWSRRGPRAAVLAGWRNSPLASLVTRDTALRREVLSFCRAVIPAWWVIRGLVLATVTNLVVTTDGIGLAPPHASIVTFVWFRQPASQKNVTIDAGAAGSPCRSNGTRGSLGPACGVRRRAAPGPAAPA